MSHCLLHPPGCLTNQDHLSEQIVALEVKSGRAPDVLPGMAAFIKAYPKAQPLLVGGQGIDIEAFLSRPVMALFN